MNVYPVIHYLDRETALREALLAQRCGAFGVFLISHHNNDAELIDVAWEVKQVVAATPFRVGVNLLSRSAIDAVAQARERALDMVWADDMGVSSRGLTEQGHACSREARKGGLELFASVAFKYQAKELDPAQAARNAHAAGFIATTSGVGTGKAPDLDKIVSMSAACEGKLAVASGMTPENVDRFSPYLAHVLVATGISQDEYRIDEHKLRHLLAKVRQV